MSRSWRRLSRARTASAAPFFRELGATSTDHGHPTAHDRRPRRPASRGAVRQGRSPAAARPPRPSCSAAQMLTEMARDEPRRRHGDADPSRRASATTTPALFDALRPRQGRRHPDRAPTTSHALKPLLDRFGNEPRLTLILFTLDESTYAPRAGAARRPLSGAQARPALVVPRQPRGHAPLPRA